MICLLALSMKRLQKKKGLKLFKKKEFQQMVMNNHQKMLSAHLRGQTKYYMSCFVVVDLETNKHKINFNRINLKIIKTENNG